MADRSDRFRPDRFRPDRDGCAEVAPHLAEVATGAATGADRARVLNHLVGCSRCRLELEGLSRAADDLLLLAPEWEPPAGFETAVLARLAPLPSRHRTWTRARRLVLQAAAVVVAAALAAGLAWWRAAPDRRLAGEYREAVAVGDGSFLRAAPVTTDAGAVVGHLYAYQGHPSWIYVTVTGAPNPGRYDVTLTARDGRQWQLGACVAAHRYCGAGATIVIPVDDVSTVRLDPADGPGMVARLEP